MSKSNPEFPRFLNLQQTMTLQDMLRKFYLSRNEVQGVFFFPLLYHFSAVEPFLRPLPAEAAVADINDPKRVVVPSLAPLSELGFRRQLLKDGGEEKVVPPPGRNDESEKLRKSEEEAAEGALEALVSNRPARKIKQRKGPECQGKEDSGAYIQHVEG